VFELLPLYFITDNGIFASHAGIVKGINSKDDIQNIKIDDEDPILAMTWGDPTQTGDNRGWISGIANYTEEELVSFLEKVGSSVILRGHDYDTLGYSQYSDRLFTVFTSRRYKDEGNGGILIARVKLDKEVKTILDINVLNYDEGEWRDYTIRRFEG